MTPAEKLILRNQYAIMESMSERSFRYLEPPLSETRLFLAEAPVETINHERMRCDKIVCEEWAKIVKEFELRPGSVTEKYSARVINRIRGIE